MTRRLLAAAAAARLLLALAPAHAQGPTADGRAAAVAELKDPQGARVGAATLVQYAHGVVGHVEIEGMEPGWHAFHVHETGSCSPDFQAAGGHFDPLGQDHGLDEGPRHAGDVGNFWVADDGRAKFEFITTRIRVGGPPEIAAATPDIPEEPPGALVFDPDGAAVVVHAQPDDHVTDPAGDAGERIACGVLEQRGAG
jgi:Cu-Zn family superoxide dismutase